MNDNMFSNVDFGGLREYIENDDITDVSYSNSGQLWVKSLSMGLYRVTEDMNQVVNDQMVEKIAFQCANIMGKVFNMAHPFLDAESAELRLNFVHNSIARNGVAMVIRKTPAKIRLNKDKLLNEKYITEDIHNFLIRCVEGHCNIIVSGETGAGKTEFVKYLAAHTKENEKIITIEDTLELHLDRIFPHRDIVAMKTNNIASYSEVLVTCMRQNPKWILLSEVRSAEAVTAVRNSISSGHNIISTIHSDKAQSIPHRMYSLLEANIDVDQFLKTIYRYIQLGVHIKARQDIETKKMIREVAEVVEFFVNKDNLTESRILYRKTPEGSVIRNEPSSYLVDYLAAQGVTLNGANIKGDNSNESNIINNPEIKIQEFHEIVNEPKEEHRFINTEKVELI
jgi:pilus assembly protein CpaF